jgi:predicted TIM-barrel fold metal-dependent hydrolase
VGITSAWVSSYEGLLHRDIAAVNERVAGACRGQPLVPFGVVNPSLPDWQDDIRRCREVWNMPGVRLFPNYHGYSLDSPLFAELVSLCDRHGLIVQLAAKMEDERTHHPLVKVPPVDLTPLQDVLAAHPKVNVILLNAMAVVRGEALARLVESHQVWVETATLEGAAGIEGILKSIPANRLLIGTHAPLFLPESAVAKLDESNLGETLRRQISLENAAALIPPR